jgi:hypothetical protein
VRLAAESNTERRVLVTSMRQALWARPALLVRGSSRRITIMRFRPANIRLENPHARIMPRLPIESSEVPPDSQGFGACESF